MAARPRINWLDDRPLVSTRQVSKFLRMGWRTALAAMKDGRIPSVRCGKSSQPYYRTSWKTIRAFMDGKPPVPPGNH